MRRGAELLLSGALLALVPRCTPDAAAPRGGTDAMGPELAHDLDAARGARFLFMHHSVGRNVLAGIDAVGGGRVRVATLEEAAADPAPMLAHFSGGRNGDPKGKMDAFAAALVAEPRVRVDVAFMKLCYVDFDPRTDVDALFAHYRRTIDEVERARPDVRIGHVSVPLKARPSDARSWLRRLLGLEVWEDAANAKRAEFNRRLAAAFPDRPLLDLARVESTGPDGAPVGFELGGARYPSLFPGYTDDGGHLNAAGQRVAGAAAVRFLAAAAARPVAVR